MSGNHNYSSDSRRRTPWDDIDDADKTGTQLFLVENYTEAYERKHPDLSETNKYKLINSFTPKTCPNEDCLSTDFKKDGLSDNHAQCYKCNKCGTKFTPLTGTIFDDHKISTTCWIDFWLSLIRHESLTEASWNSKVSFTTIRLWLKKTAILAHEYNSHAPVLSGDVYLDETYYSVNKKDRTLKEDGTEPSGLSRNKICIGVACTKGRIICAVEGKAKPSKKMTLAAFGDKIAPGSKLIHDGEKSHKILIETLNLIDETHKTAETKGLLDSQNPLRRVNKVHYQLKHFFGKHSGFDRDNIDQYLDIFMFIMNPPKQPLEKIETLLNLAFSLRQNIKYRDLFSRDNVSEEAPF